MDLYVAHLFRDEAVWCELALGFEFESDGLDRCGPGVQIRGFLTLHENETPRPQV
jgi:hypothetical protein